jgi:hypothetical protein
MRLAALLAGVALCGAQAEERWRMQYFHDEDDSELFISDLKFASPKVGIAVGALREERGVRPMSVVTTDGGTHWSQYPLKEAGRSVFFLNDSLGWLVTEKGIWRTEESGRSWRKIKSISGIVQVRFLDAERGFAVGERKQAYQTVDGGENWTKLAFLDEVKTREEYTHFTWIEFPTKDVGMIGGVSRPPRRTRQRLPDWMDPEEASRRRAWPQLIIMVETRDGGKTWKASSASIFGQMTASRFSPGGWMLGLIEYTDSFDYPSEVLRVDWRTGEQKRFFREKNRRITDIGVGGAGGAVFLAGTEQAGSLQSLPVPRKVKILRTGDGQSFHEMAVDYRATARRVRLASAGPEEWWAATDTGMILKLTK